MPENEAAPEARVGKLDASTAAARKRIHEENRLSWNEATRAHNSHKTDQAKFFREGGQKMFPEEIELLGDLGSSPVRRRPIPRCHRRSRPSRAILGLGY